MPRRHTARQAAASRRNLALARQKRRRRRNIAFATVAVGTIGLSAASYGAVKHSRKTRPGRMLRKQLSAPPQLALPRGKTNLDQNVKYVGKRPVGASKIPQKPIRGKRVFRVSNDFNHTVTLVKRPRPAYDATRRTAYVPKPRKAATSTRRQQQIRSQFDTMNGQKLWRKKNVPGILSAQPKGK